MKLTFSTYFRQMLKYEISSKSVQWEQSCSMRTDGHDKHSRFSQLCESAKKVHPFSFTYYIHGNSILPFYINLSFTNSFNSQS